MNIASLVFLVVLFVLTPRAALRSARELRRAHAAGTPPPRLRIAISTMFALTVLWFLAQMNALMMGRSLFALGEFGGREIAIGAGALAVLLLAIPVSRARRDPADERRRLIYGFAPRDGREYAVFSLVALMAAVAEESAYRGVAVWILQPVFGSLGPAVFLSAMAFSVAHAVQGARAMVVILGVALVFHALVYLTNTLVIAMVVHVVYDGVAGIVAGRRARQLAAEDAARAPVPVATS